LVERQGLSGDVDDLDVGAGHAKPRKQEEKASNQFGRHGNTSMMWTQAVGIVFKAEVEQSTCRARDRLGPWKGLDSAPITQIGDATTERPPPTVKILHWKRFA
jgi:hypothetical protein